MQSATYDIPSEAIAYTILSLEVCSRLDKWAKQPARSPLVSLVKNHVEELVAETRCLGSILSCPDLSSRVPHEKDAGRRLCSLEQLDSTLRSVRILLEEASNLLDFCSLVEHDGDDGAANAVYARLFVLNNAGVQAKENMSFAVKLRRFHPILCGILSRWYGLDATSVNWWWGTGVEPLPTSVIFNDLIPELYSLAKNLTSQLIPRYVHLYDAPHDPPYLVDSSAFPFSGSHGIVRKVTQIKTRELFAQKTFQHVYSSADRQKILRELGVLELCIHRNIVQLVEAYEVREEPNLIHIIMAPWAPYTLLQFLRSPDTSRKAKCPWFAPNLLESDTCVYRVMYEIADAVAYLHGLSIKHKDLKPDNILLHQEETNRVVPVITDVGVSKIYRQNADTDYTKSSYQYLSLEQLKTEESSLKSDVWQLGCCFAMLLVVARGSTSALERLWNSFERTDDDCSCNIAMESKLFMRTLGDICVPGIAAQERAHCVVSRMLELQPSLRVDIETVKTEFRKLSQDALT